TTAAAPADWLRELAACGIDHVIRGSGPRVDLPALLDALGELGLNEILVEGGGRLLGSFFDAGLVDRVAAFIAPVIVGGAEASGPVMGRGIATMAEAWRLSDTRLRTLGDDLLLEGTVRAVPSLVEVA
ncbi:MAG: dihydrofolate reductase family protein, partial [Chloroflexota bacterium]|nr:dihydrofolate reductase family protein [Chloroflexota bacterium]